MANTDRVFVVVRFDTERYSQFRPENAEHQFTAIEAFPDEDSALREVKRLNALNGPKGDRYSIRSAPWHPLHG